MPHNTHDNIVCVHSHKCTPAQTPAHTHTLSFTNTDTPSHPYTLSLSHTHSTVCSTCPTVLTTILCVYIHTNAHPHTLPPIHRLSLSPTPTHTLTHTHSLSLTHSTLCSIPQECARQNYMCIFTQMHTPTHSHPYTISLCLTHTTPYVPYA